MMKSTATVETTHASRYLQQLCKHWAHKNDCSFDVHQGRVLFTSGNLLELEVIGDQMIMCVTVPDGGDLGQFKQVVNEHLLRFAFREKITINWS